MSDKLISAKWLREYLDSYDTKVLELAALQMLNNFHAALIEAPAVDAVEVVRCRQCGLGVKKRENGEVVTYCGLDWGMRGVLGPNDFCSYGKRREEK